MNMRHVPCSLYPSSKSLSVLYNVQYWDHLSLHVYGHMELTEIVSRCSCKEGDHGKDLESRVAVNLLCNRRFWKQLNGYSYRKCIATPGTCIENTEGFYLWRTSDLNVAKVQSVNSFICEIDIQIRTIPCFFRFIDSNSLSISRDGLLRTSLYDKRDDFNFKLSVPE